MKVLWVIGLGVVAVVACTGSADDETGDGAGGSGAGGSLSKGGAAGRGGSVGGGGVAGASGPPELGPDGCPFDWEYAEDKPCTEQGKLCGDEGPLCDCGSEYVVIECFLGTWIIGDGTC